MDYLYIMQGSAIVPRGRWVHVLLVGRRGESYWVRWQFDWWVLSRILSFLRLPDNAGNYLGDTCPNDVT